MSPLAALRNLDRRDVGAWPAAARHGCAALLFATVACLGWAALLSGDGDARDTLAGREARLKQDFVHKRGEALVREALRDRLAVLQQAQRRLLGRLPRREELPALLVAIAQAATASGLLVEQFQPGTEAFADGCARQAIQVTLRGEAARFAQFTRLAAGLPRLVVLDWEDVSLSVQGGGVLLLRGRLAIYRQPEHGEEAGAPR